MNNARKGKQPNRKLISKAFASVVALACLTSLSNATTKSLQTKCDSATATAARSHSGRVQVIVELARAATQSELSRFVRLGADVYRNLSVIHSVAMSIPAHNLTRLAGLPFVQNISQDEEVRKTDLYTVSSSGAGAVYAKYGLTGLNIVVAVLDSGIQNQPDFGDKLGVRIKGMVNFTTEDVADHCGHGTHVAGIIGGNGQSSSGKGCFETFYGIARRANLFEVKVLNTEGQGLTSQAIAGIQWVILNASKQKIRILNISFGHPVGESYTKDPLCQAVEQAWKAGIVVVCAAGNDGRLFANTTQGANNGGYGTNYGSIESPGNDPYVITVGAMKQIDTNRNDDTIATYSSRGPSPVDNILKPDLVAAGNQIISVGAEKTYLIDNYASTVTVPPSVYTTQGNQANKYERLSGTSMAAPVVSGAVALLLQANPTLTPDTVKARLMASADKWTAPGGTADPCTYGAGYLDIPAALASTLVATGSATSPDLYQDSSGDVYVDMSHAIWGKSFWGTGLTDLRAVWGENAVLGASSDLLSESNILWGKAFWGDDQNTTITSAGVNLSSTSIVINGEH